jgi:signal-transduction protein with cAMP-binding, CBS, and nucleotidyltransferase domain
VPRYMEEALDILSQKPFFKRFSKAQLKPFLPKLEIEQYEVDNMVFVDERICVILGGAVEVRKNVNG